MTEDAVDQTKSCVATPKKDRDVGLGETLDSLVRSIGQRRSKRRRRHGCRNRSELGLDSKYQLLHEWHQFLVMHLDVLLAQIQDVFFGDFFGDNSIGLALKQAQA